MAVPRIALIHATPVAVEPSKLALAAGWPEANAVTILDDSLSADRAKSSDLTDEMTDRIIAIAKYARNAGADGVLFTCSSFGPAIQKAAEALDVPVLKPNEAMFEAAIGNGGASAMIITFPPAQVTMEAEFEEEARRLSPDAKLTTFVVEPAMKALLAGNPEEHNRLVAEAAKTLTGFKTIVLGHFSTARAAKAVREVTNINVLTSPDAAVAKMRRLILQGA